MKLRYLINNGPGFSKREQIDWRAFIGGVYIMKRSLLIIIFSIFIASLLLPGGYGSWADVLTIKGKIKVVEPPPPLTPIPTPALVPIIPIIDGTDSTTPEIDIVAVDAGLPDNTENAGSIIQDEGDQTGQAAELIQQDDSSGQQVQPDGEESSTDEQRQSDSNKTDSNSSVITGE